IGPRRYCRRRPGRKDQTRTCERNQAILECSHIQFSWNNVGPFAASGAPSFRQHKPNSLLYPQNHALKPALARELKARLNYLITRILDGREEFTTSATKVFDSHRVGEPATVWPAILGVPDVGKIT